MKPTPALSTRRYDLDWLRVIAILTLGNPCVDQRLGLFHQKPSAVLVWLPAPQPTVVWTTPYESATHFSDWHPTLHGCAVRYSCNV